MLIIPIFLFSQTSVLTQGNLVYLNVNQNEINRADTIGHWEDSHDEFELISSSEFYSKMINFNDKKYFIKLYQPRCTLCEGSFYFLENYHNNTKLYLGTYNSENVNLPFNIFVLNKYIISFFNDDYYIDESDSLHSLFNQIGSSFSLINIAGKIDSLYWCNFEKKNYFQKHALLNLNHFPDLDTTSTQWFYNGDGLNPNSFIEKIQQIDTNLFLLGSYTTGWAIGSFVNDSLRTVKNYTQSFLPKTAKSFSQVFSSKWHYRSPFLYFDDTRGIYTYIKKWQFNLEDTTFSYISDIIEGLTTYGNYSIDDGFNYLTYMQNDSLILFNIEQEKIEKSWDLSGFNNARLPFLAYPEIYFHQSLAVTSIEDYSIIPEDFSFTAYPNPFNNQVTFKITNPLTQVIKLTIYDILGKELFSKELDHNTAKKFTWHPRNLNSGIYFAVVKSGRNIKAQKLVLIK
ncbi:MAG: T9SS type A sorting domain-containing protein [Calditrichaeota bacterium]|nr:T9SS type A sorting domain-containing protein [Calditrichota bacterium]